RRRHTRFSRDWSSDVCSSDLLLWRQSGLKDVRDRAARADIALLTVGEMSPGATVFRYGIVPQNALRTLTDKGAVANMLCYFVDEIGRASCRERVESSGGAGCM